VEQFDEALNKETVEKVVTQEGLTAVSQLFEFFTEALDVAVEWISMYEDMPGDQIRWNISQNVHGQDMKLILSKLRSLSSIQKDLDKK